jgi:hypothetical protein
VDGIAGQLVIYQKCCLWYELLNDTSGVSVLECNGILLPDLKIHLFSPQILLSLNTKVVDMPLSGTSLILSWTMGITLILHSIAKALLIIHAFYNIMCTV